MVKVFTWNTQGNFESGTKRAWVEKLLSQCHVGLIQEGGGRTKSIRFRGVEKRKVFLLKGSAPGAKNTRCTNWAMWSYGEGEKWKSKTIGGGLAGRQAAGVLVNGVLFVSWHSTALSEEDTDSAMLFREVIDTILKPGYAKFVLVGGDFNTPLATMIHVANGVTSGRMRGGFDNTIFYSSQATHKSGQTLDYFVLFYKGQPRNFDYQINVLRVPASDHDPVVLELDPYQ